LKKISIPNYKDMEIKTIIFDFNGTIATDGIVNKDLKRKILDLSNDYNVVIITADTNNTVKKQFENTNILVEIIKNTNDKLEVSKKYVPFVVFGNGNNDIEIFNNSQLSIGVIGEEGCSAKLLLNCDIVVNNINNGIDLLLNNNRLKATLRK